MAVRPSKRVGLLFALSLAGCDGTAVNPSAAALQSPTACLQSVAREQRAAAARLADARGEAMRDAARLVALALAARREHEESCQREVQCYGKPEFNSALFSACLQRLEPPQTLSTDGAEH